MPPALCVYSVVEFWAVSFTPRSFEWSQSRVLPMLSRVSAAILDELPHIISKNWRFEKRPRSSRFLARQGGLKGDAADTGALTLIKRFGSAANLNIDLHCLLLDGSAREPVS